MTRGQPCSLCRALTAILPGSEVLNRRERSWHSATFSGSRIMLGLMVAIGTTPDAIADFRQNLPENDFQLTKGFVADIAITGEGVSNDGRLQLEIEALVLDE
jgi:hypothetical protein